VQGCRSCLGRFADEINAIACDDMDGAEAPALFSGSDETVWAALPSRPAALWRNPAPLRSFGRVFHFVAALQVRLTA